MDALLSGELDVSFLATTANKPQKWLGIPWGLIAYNSHDKEEPADLHYLKTTKHPVSSSGTTPISLP